MTNPGGWCTDGSQKQREKQEGPKRKPSGLVCSLLGESRVPEPVSAGLGLRFCMEGVSKMDVVL